MEQKPKSQRSVTKKAATYHHGDLRRALLDATLRLIEEKGAEGFTLRAAAKLAGVSDAAPYHHFADKEALLAAVAEEGFRELKAELHAVSEGITDPQDAARAMGTAYVLFAATHPSHFRVMVSRRVHQQTEHPELFEAATSAFELVRNTLLQNMGNAGVELPPEQVVFGSWGLVHGLAFLAIDGHLGRIADDGDALRSLVEGAMSVLSGPSRKGAPR